MKPNLVLILLCLIIFACHSPKKQQVSNRSVSTINKTDSTNKEYLNWDSIKLNGTLPMASNFKNALIKLGKPDSTITPNYSNISSSYWEGKFTYCYFKGVQFEKYHDSLAFSGINFKKSPGWYLSYKQIKFDGSTTIEDFKKFFPNSIEKKVLHSTSMDKNLWIRIDTSPDASDDAWDFFFDRNTGKLISIDYWIDD